MSTTITYAGKIIDFKEDIDETFAIEANYVYAASVMVFLRTVPFDTIMPLNSTDPNYLLFVKALIFIHKNGYDRCNDFELEFNSKGRPFQSMKKLSHQKVVQTYNIPTLASLSLNTPQEDMATKKTATTASVQLITPETVNKSYSVAKKAISDIVVEMAEIIEITSTEEAKNAAAMVKNAKQIKKDVEAVRVAQKEPYKNACEQIDGVAKHLVEELEPHTVRMEKLVMEWDRAVAKKKAEADAQAEKLRQAENQKVIDAQLVLDQARNSIVEFERFCAKEIMESKSSAALGQFWAKTLKPFDPMVYAEVLQPEATAMKQRLIALGMAKDAVLTSPADFTIGAAWDAEKAKYQHLATVAVAAIDEKVNENISHVALNAEVNKSVITQEQLSNEAKPNLNFRRTLKYRVTDITKVPVMMPNVDAPITMLVINEDAMKQVMKVYRKNIDADPNGLPGIEFYYEETPSGR